MKVVGTMFFENEKLLIDKPRKRPTYQMIGGKVEDGETTLQAAIRECHEELGDEAIFDEEKFELIMEFDEIATSDGITPIHFYVYKYTLGMSVALSFAKKILAGDTTEYLEFLTKGGSESPLDELIHAGVDPRVDSVYDDAFTYFEKTLDEFSELMKVKR